MSDIFIQSAHEAVSSLKLLRSSAVETIAGMLSDCSILHPRAVTTAYRKNGEQLGKEDKKALGLRANAFLSKTAAAELSEAGLRRPLEAHEVTLLRAHFNAMRRAAVEKAETIDADFFEYSTISNDCPGCVRMRDQKMSADDLRPSHPPDCEREACPVMIVAKVDFIGRALAKYKARSGG
jgi:hypothetical protein